MLNQSYEYYEFLSKILVKWLNERDSLQAADKFFILLDSEEDTDYFYKSLKDLDFDQKESFKSEAYDYETIALNKEGKRVLFVAPVDGITQDFLVTIRNRVNANQEEWGNTAVVFIVNDPLDSIMGGSYDLSQKGAPFHSQTIQSEVKNEIAASEMTLGEQAVLENYLAEISDQTTTILKDYETLFSTLEQKTISNDHFNAMGYFPDEQLDSFDRKTIDQRLNKNSDLYLEIEKMHEYFDVKESLENKIDGDTLINELADEDEWRETPFSRITEGIERFERLKKIDINIDVDQIEEDNERLWFRLAGDTAARRRKAYMMRSMKGMEDNQLRIEIPFDTRINKSNVTEAHTYLYEDFGEEHEEASYEIKNKSFIFTFENLDPEKTYGGKISYKHKNKSNLNFVITFLLVPFSLTEIERLRTEFQVSVLGAQRARRYFFGMTNDQQKYSFGNGQTKLVIDHPEELGELDLANQELELTSNFDGGSRDDLRVRTKLNGYFFPVEFLDIDYRSIPSSAIQIEGRRLGEKDEEFIYRDQKILVGSHSIAVEKSYQAWLRLEEAMVTEQSLYGQRIQTHYEAKALDLPDSVAAAYRELFDYYDSQETLPSLAIFNEDHLALLEKIVFEVEQALENNLVEMQSIPKQIRNLSKIGLIENSDSFDMSPLNPLLIAYQLELAYQLEGSEKVPSGNVLRTLNPENLMPYVQIDDQSYQSNYTSAYPRWLFYESLNERKLSDLSSNIINQRLDDYLTQYNFLFQTNPEMHLNLAGINIVDEITFFDAMIHFMVKRMRETDSLDAINPINIYVNRLGNSLNSLFHELYALNTIEELNNHLKEKLPANISDRRQREYSEYEVVEALQEKLNIYQLPKDFEEDEEDLFFHITLYQFSQEDDLNRASMRNLTKNYSMSGLLNNSEFILSPNKEKYMNGFGLGEGGENSSDFIRSVKEWNSFMASVNRDTDTYQEEMTWVNYISHINDSRVDQLFDSSHWVTFLNLDVDLSYFYDERERELLVIHYTDQSTSNQYESITVTNDTRQYDQLLEQAISHYSDEIDTHEIIRNFNVINGQWLLKLISDQEKNRGYSNVFREKLSIISAYKELLGILDHPNFHWVPISLEEILRVSGMVGFSQKDGLFSSKNLGESGATSDDLLMMGIERIPGKELKIHFLPVEVKVGINASGVRKKAIEQVEKTDHILRKYLGVQNEDVFMREYYLNFFISLMITNLEKMLASGIYGVEEIPHYKELKDNLRSGYYQVSEELENYYGKGMIFEFTKDTSARTAVRLSESNISLIKVPEEDAYNIVSVDTREVIEKISSHQFDFDKNILLRQIHGESENSLQTEEDLEPSSQEKETTDLAEAISSEKDIRAKIDQEEPARAQENEKVAEEESSQTQAEPETEADLEPADDSVIRDEEETGARVEEKVPEIPAEESSTKSDPEPVLALEDKRLLMGQVLHSNHQVYWEYGNKDLSNRHLLITGKSGQGKTYFIQTLLGELSRNKISSLIIDYTDGFLPNQLEPMLKEHFGEQLKPKFVYQEKLPLNPFKIQQLDLGGFYVDEEPRDMVDRIVQIIDFVFDLGIQQRTLLSEVILEGYRLNQESYTFTHLKEDLVSSEESDRGRLYGRISTLLARDPFSYDSEFSWADIFNDQGEIHILQLKGFQRNIQQVMIEFMLWDLFQYATKTGLEDTPLPIILDEIQNLNFSPNSPTVKILREGRKFGLSGVFATQSLDSVVGKDSEAIYNAAQQVHFLPPDSQIRNLARQISSTTKEASEIEAEFKKLLELLHLKY